MDLLEELKEAAEATELESFRSELIETVAGRMPPAYSDGELDFAFVCEVGARMSAAEEFQDFIPCHDMGTGQRSRKFRVDGYELDEVDDSIRLLIADFKGKKEIETITRTRAESVFSQLRAFVEESISGRIWSGAAAGESMQTRELAGILEQRHRLKDGGSRGVSRYRMYLITDCVLSDRLKDLPSSDLDGVPVEFHVWDVSRLKAASTSSLGTEELVVDFSTYPGGGLPCLRASQNEEYEGYLCVISADVLADLYDRFGSRLLEGNVRSFLSTSGKVNRGIQATIRAEPGRFFVYNNGISATATSAVVEETESGPRLISAKYLQIVNGGQTTASLHVAKRKDNEELASIHVQMKLSVVRAKSTEKLDEMIQHIAKYSNSQNKVSDADFFSTHPFHRSIERRSRSIKAPATEGAQFNTYWFYERARGQYLNEQSKMTVTQKKAFQREHPRSQLVAKTDLAKYENSWRKLPHIVSRHAQKNFLNFAEYVRKEFGEDGVRFDNDNYYKEVVAKAIVFKFIERLVSGAKETWYSGDYRAQIVTYTISKLISLVENEALGNAIDLKRIWNKQGVSLALAKQLEEIAKAVSFAITTPPVAQMNIGEWCKKEECWTAVDKLSIPLMPAFVAELASVQEVVKGHEADIEIAVVDRAINNVVEVVRLRDAGCWLRLEAWSQQYSPIYGTEADLVRNAQRRVWVPTDRQAGALIKLLKRMQDSGFTAE